MLRNLKALIGYTVQATDGDVGGVEDFYLDDYDWSLRYLVLDSEGWLTDRLLLFSPRSLGKPRHEEKVLQLTLSKEAIQNSPSFARDRPIGRQEEIDLHRHYQWPFYWDTLNDQALGPGTVAAYPLIDLADQIAEEHQRSVDPDEAPHLIRMQEIRGYRVQARDGAAGHIEDILVEDENWNVLFLIVDTGSLLPGKKVLVSPEWVLEIDQNNSLVQLDLNQETVRNSPVYEPSRLFERNYETRLQNYHQSRRSK